MLGCCLFKAFETINEPLQKDRKFIRLIPKSDNQYWITLGKYMNIYAK